MNETLTLNDGTVLEKSDAHESVDRLFIYVRSGLSMREVFDLLDDPEKTETIVKLQYSQTTVYTGYNRLIALTDEGDGLITATMRKA